MQELIYLLCLVTGSNKNKSRILLSFHNRKIKENYSFFKLDCAYKVKYLNGYCILFWYDVS